MQQKAMEAAGLEALEWLISIQTSSEGHFLPIGNQGFYPRGGNRARFDQQPIEAHATISACIDAFHLTGQAWWKYEAIRAFEWYLGRNDVGAALYDSLTGGCCDGLSTEAQARIKAPNRRWFSCSRWPNCGCWNTSSRPGASKHPTTAKRLPQNAETPHSSCPRYRRYKVFRVQIRE